MGKGRDDPETQDLEDGGGQAFSHGERGQGDNHRSDLQTRSRNLSWDGDAVARLHARGGEPGMVGIDHGQAIAVIELAIGHQLINIGL